LKTLLTRKNRKNTMTGERRNLSSRTTGGKTGPLLTTTPAQDQPLGLLDHPEQIFDGYVLDKACVLPFQGDARAQVIVVADYDPGGDTNLPYLRSIISTHDHMRTKRRRLLIEDIGVGETYLVVGAVCSEDVSERLAVHHGRYGEQYAHIDQCDLSQAERILVGRKGPTW
jgi:hypothetical protein